MEDTKQIVSMDNGEQVEFGARQKFITTIEIHEGLLVAKCQCKNGKTVTCHIPAELMIRFAQHGAKQKFNDSCAGIKEVDDCFLTIEALAKQIAGGDWNAIKQGNGDSMAGTSILIRAIVEAKGKDVETVKTWLSTKTHAEKMALRKAAGIKEVVERLEAERDANKKVKESTINTSALLDELA